MESNWNQYLVFLRLDTGSIFVDYMYGESPQEALDEFVRGDDHEFLDHGGPLLPVAWSPAGVVRCHAQGVGLDALGWILRAITTDVGGRFVTVEGWGADSFWRPREV